MILFNVLIIILLSSDHVVHNMQTGVIQDDSVSVFDVYVPPEIWTTGEQAVKQVSVVNNNQRSVLVRISFEEEITHLLSEGTQRAERSPNPDDAYIPVEVNTSGYSSENGWVTPEEMDLDTKGIPEGMKVLGKSTDGETPGFAIYYSTQYEGKSINQKVTANFSVSGTTLNVTNIQYYFYEGVQADTIDWTGKSDTGSKVSVPPIQERIHTFLSEPSVNISYVGNVFSSQEGGWWYNQGDGYFYYLAKLEPRQTSEFLVDHLYISSSAGTIKVDELKLNINMEAVYNTKQSLTSEEGWGLADSDLIDLLSQYCDS